ncbi:MAG TPA: hypothetical protein VEQ58_14870, partial [Polyangiaceae bacterium]|nr:hypothetical protein [Polyangiaceae bacterium]
MLPLALTYLAHSLVFAAAASVLCSLKSLAWAARHACWRLALLGPFFSAGISRWSNRVELGRVIEVPATSA